MLELLSPGRASHPKCFEPVGLAEPQLKGARSWAYLIDVSVGEEFLWPAN